MECPYCNCKDITEHGFKEIDPFLQCKECKERFPTHIEFISDKEKRAAEFKKGKAELQRRRNERHKKDKTIDTYIDLASAIQRAGGSVGLLKEFKSRSLADFLEEVCSTNNIRFRHERKE